MEVRHGNGGLLSWPQVQIHFYIFFSVSAQQLMMDTTEDSKSLITDTLSRTRYRFLKQKFNSISRPNWKPWLQRGCHIGREIWPNLATPRSGSSKKNVARIPTAPPALTWCATRPCGDQALLQSFRAALRTISQFHNTSTNELTK